jgi:FkbM family methyltransferase
MSSPKSMLKALIRATLNRIPTSSLEAIEDLVQKQLGKGSGAWTTKSEAEAVARFSRMLGIRTVVAVDAGANSGDWTAELLAHLPTSTVIAFEPSEIAFAKLQARFPGDARVNTVNIALGNKNFRSILYADKSGSGLGSLTKRRVKHFDIEFTHQEQIDIQTLDSWLSQNKVKTIPNILKMDVEGHELDLLLGATEALENLQIIQFEFGGSNIDTRTFFQDFWYFFLGRGFDIYRLTPSKPMLIANYNEGDEVFRATNFIAVRRNAS